MTYRGFFSSARFIVIGFTCSPAYKTTIIQTGEWKIVNSVIAFAHPSAREFSRTVLSPSRDSISRCSETISSAQFFRKPNSVGCSFPEKTIVMERPKMYVSPDGVYRVSQRQPLRVFTSERSNSGTATWIERCSRQRHVLPENHDVGAAVRAKPC